MVDLPGVPRRQVTSEAPRNRISPQDIAQPSQMLGDALGRFGAGITEIGRDMQRAADTTAVSRHLDAAKTQALKLSIDANGDANLFEKSWGAYAKDTLKNVPKKYRGEVGNKLTAMGGETYRGIFAAAADRTGKIALDAIDARIGTITGEMTDLARTGQTASEDYQSRRVELDDLIRQKTENRLIAYSPESAKADRDAIEDKFVGAAISGELETIYASKGFAAAQARAQELLNDDTDGLPKIKKVKAIAEGLKSLRAIYAQDAGARREFMATVSEGVARLREGNDDPDDPLWNEFEATAREMRLPGAVQSIRQARAFARTIPMRGMNLEQSIEYGNKLLDTPDISRAAAAISSVESGGNYAALGPVTASGDRAYGKYQVMGANIGEWTQAALGKTMTADEFLASPEAQDAVFAHRFGGYIQKYGNVEDAASAWFTGGPRSTGAGKKDILGTSGSDYVEKFSAAYGSSADGFVKGLRPAIIADIKSDLTDSLAAADKKLDAGMTIEPEEMQTFATAAKMIDDAATYERVETLAGRSLANAASDDVSAARITEMIDEMRAPGDKGEALVKIEMRKQLEANQNRRQELLDKDPMGVAIERGFIKPGGEIIDSSNVADAGRILAGRVTGLQRLAFDEKTGPLSVLRPSEADALGAAWRAGDANQKLALLGGMVQSLPRETLMATLAAFTDKADTEALAVAGALYASDPEVGAAVVRGAEALRVNPKFGYDAAGGTQDEKQARNDYFPPTAVAPGLEPAWQSHLDAARAVYADMSSRAGDATGAFDEERWKSALDAVTGGVVEYNGQKTIAPVPGIGQRQFDSVMASLPDSAFLGATTPNGTPLTARFVRKYGTLHGYGDGRYVIKLGDTDTYAVQSTGAAALGPGPSGTFVLDLRPYLDPTKNTAANRAKMNPRLQELYRALDENRHYR